METGCAGLGAAGRVPGDTMAEPTRARQALGIRKILGLVLCTSIGTIAFSASAQPSERGWVRDEVRLNLRMGPGNENRIIGVLKTGNAVEILNNESEWTEVRLEDGREGWIPVGYLVPEPPASLRVGELEDRVGQLSRELASSQSEATRLREVNSRLAGEARQRRDDAEVQGGGGGRGGGDRWPEMITGASILVVGMLVGAALHRNAARHPSSRIRI